ALPRRARMHWGGRGVWPHGYRADGRALIRECAPWQARLPVSGGWWPQCLRIQYADRQQGEHYDGPINYDYLSFVKGSSVEKDQTGPRRDYCRNMGCCDHYPLVLAPRRVGWTPSLYTQYARYGIVQRWKRIYAISAYRTLSRDCGSIHCSTLAGVRAHWCPCLVAPGSGRAKSQPRIWCAALLCPRYRRPHGGSHDVRGARAPRARLAVGPRW